MAASEQTFEPVTDVPVKAVATEMDALQRWVDGRVSWLRARAQELSAAPAALLQRAVIPPKQVLKAANPRILIRTLSDTGAKLGSRLTFLTRENRPADPVHDAVVPPAVSGPTPAGDKMRTFWQARVDVLHKMLEKKPSL